MKFTGHRQEFEFECLQRVSGDAVDSLLEALDEIQREGIVDSVAKGHRRYRFSHDLIREGKVNLTVAHPIIS
jgi:hypothetical protein